MAELSKNLNILITAPNLNTTKNVSGISSVVNNIIQTNRHHYFHFQLGSLDGSSKGIVWLINLLYAFVRLPIFIKKKKINLVHINVPCDPKGICRETITVFLAKIMNMPILVHLHGGIFLTKGISNPAWKFLFKIILKNSNQVAVLGTKEKQFLDRELNYPNATVLHNSVPIRTNTNEKKIQEPVQILYLGRIEKNKGLREIIDAVAKLHQALPLRLVVCGDGEDRETFVRDCTNILQDNFQYRGIVSGKEKENVLSESNIFILPSYFEGLPIALLEAMSEQLVPVVTSVGSIPEVVSHGVNGLLIKPHDSEDLYLQLKHLLSSPEEITKIGKAAKETIRKSYSMDFYITSLEDLYRKILCI